MDSIIFTMVYNIILHKLIVLLLTTVPYISSNLRRSRIALNLEVEDASNSFVAPMAAAELVFVLL